MAATANGRKSRRVEAEQAQAAAQAQQVSPAWLLAMGTLALAVAALCVWGALCLVFWQGAWQLLYHPAKAIAHTPASVELAYNNVSFATTEDGTPRLAGWWIPATQPARVTALYLHSADGNIGDTVDALARLHAANLNVLAFDYRGYGQSQRAHPSEARWRQDADWALNYLTNTRHVLPGAIVLVGHGLGANLALDMAAEHPELAGVVIERLLDEPEQVIFRDSRAQLVPAHSLVDERWDPVAPATDLRIPSLWFYTDDPDAGHSPQTAARVTSVRMEVWLTHGPGERANYVDALTRWADDLVIKR
ncbi:MAG: alpha/beta fold hydrolase [Terracidiphilus sp.]|nr:alpha/beta fold hydrolase [Terracidiphilus sp.]